MPIVIGALRTVTKGLVQGLEDLEIRELVDTIQTAALLRSAIVSKKIIVEICCRWKFSEKPSANAGVKKSQISEW